MSLTLNHHGVREFATSNEWDFQDLARLTQVLRQATASGRRAPRIREVQRVLLPA